MYDVIFTEDFSEKLEFYVKKRRHKKLVKDLRKVEKNFTNGVFKGDPLQGILYNDYINETYKTRMIDSTNGIGARGGFRLIYCIDCSNYEVYLLTIYHKKDMKNITSKEVNELIRNNLIEYE